MWNVTKILEKQNEQVDGGGGDLELVKYRAENIQISHETLILYGHKQPMVLFSSVWPSASWLIPGNCVTPGFKKDMNSDLLRWQRDLDPPLNRDSQLSWHFLVRHARSVQITPNCCRWRRSDTSIPCDASGLCVRMRREVPWQNVDVWKTGMRTSCSRPHEWVIFNRLSCVHGGWLNPTV